MTLNSRFDHVPGKVLRTTLSPFCQTNSTPKRSLWFAGTGRIATTGFMSLKLSPTADLVNGGFASDASSVDPP